MGFVTQGFNFFALRKGNYLDKKIKRIQKFYQTEKALVTSPFIEQTGKLNRELMSTVFEKLCIQTDKKVIADIGCGTGLLVRYFSDVRFYVGLDLVLHPTLAELRDMHHQFIQADAQRNPLADASVEFLLCLDSFEHYPDQIKAAKEFYRILKPGGSMFLSIPTYANVAGLVKKIMERSGRYKKNTWAPFDFWKPEALEHFVTPKCVKKVFTSAGFKEFKMIGYDKEVVVGLCPWVWHPKMPGKAAGLMQRIFRLFARPLVSVWPQSSLHTFWKISK